MNNLLLQNKKVCVSAKDICKTMSDALENRLALSAIVNIIKDNYAAFIDSSINENFTFLVPIDESDLSKVKDSQILEILKTYNQKAYELQEQLKFVVDGNKNTQFIERIETNWDDEYSREIASCDKKISRLRFDDTLGDIYDEYMPGCYKNVDMNDRNTYNKFSTVSYLFDIIKCIDAISVNTKHMYFIPVDRNSNKALSKILSSKKDEVASNLCDIISDSKYLQSTCKHIDQITDILKTIAGKWNGKDYATGAANFHLSCKSSEYNDRIFWMFFCQSIYNLIGDMNMEYENNIFLLEAEQGTGKSYLFSRLERIISKYFGEKIKVKADKTIGDITKAQEILSGGEAAYDWDKALYVLVSDPFFTDKWSDYFRNVFCTGLTVPKWGFQGKYKTLTTKKVFASTILSWNKRVPITLSGDERRIRVLRGIIPNSGQAGDIKEFVKDEKINLVNVMTGKNDDNDPFLQLFCQACAYVLNTPYEKFRDEVYRVDDIRDALHKYVYDKDNDWQYEFYTKLQETLRDVNHLSNKPLTNAEISKCWEDCDSKPKGTDIQFFRTNYAPVYKKLFTKKREGSSNVYIVNQEYLGQLINKLDKSSNDVYDQCDYNNFEEWTIGCKLYADRIINGPTYTDPTPRAFRGFYESKNTDNVKVNETSSVFETSAAAVFDSDVYIPGDIDITVFKNNDTSIIFDKEVSAFDLIDSSEDVEDVNPFDLIDFGDEEIEDVSAFDLIDSDEVKNEDEDIMTAPTEEEYDEDPHFLELKKDLDDAKRRFESAEINTEAKRNLKKVYELKQAEMESYIVEMMRNFWKRKYGDKGRPKIKPMSEFEKRIEHVKRLYGDEYTLRPIGEDAFGNQQYELVKGGIAI